MSKTLNAHNFLNIYRNILIFFFKKIALIQGIQLKKNFCREGSTSQQNISWMHFAMLHHQGKIRSRQIWLDVSSEPPRAKFHRCILSHYTTEEKLDLGRFGLT